MKKKNKNFYSLVMLIVGILVCVLGVCILILYIQDKIYFRNQYRAMGTLYAGIGILIIDCILYFERNTKYHANKDIRNNINVKPSTYYIDNNYKLHLDSKLIDINKIDDLGIVNNFIQFYYSHSLILVELENEDKALELFKEINNLKN